MLAILPQRNATVGILTVDLFVPLVYDFWFSFALQIGLTVPSIKPKQFGKALPFFLIASSAYVWSNGGLIKVWFHAVKRWWFLELFGQTDGLGHGTYKGMVILRLREDKGLHFLPIQFLVHMCKSQAASLLGREEVCLFFENEILPSTHFRGVLSGQSFRNFSWENLLQASYNGKVHLLKYLHHRNLGATSNTRTFLKVAIACSKVRNK